MLWSRSNPRSRHWTWPRNSWIFIESTGPSSRGSVSSARSRIAHPINGHRPPMTIRRPLLLLAFSSMALLACASANKRYEQGQELEREGRPLEAANRYIQALQKDARLDSARSGLRSSGVAAITEYLGAESATDLTTVTGVDQAADNYLAIDDLHSRALQVGVDLPLPPDYAV